MTEDYGNVYQNSAEQVNEDCVQISGRQLEFYQILYTSLEGRISKYTLLVIHTKSHPIVEVVLHHDVTKATIMAMLCNKYS